jgi:hypothetical protein
MPMGKTWPMGQQREPGVGLNGGKDYGLMITMVTSILYSVILNPMYFCTGPHLQ